MDSIEAPTNAENGSSPLHFDAVNNPLSGDRTTDSVVESSSTMPARPLEPSAMMKRRASILALEVYDTSTQYRKGQHVICADPKVLDRHLKAAVGRGGLEVDATELIWTPYKEQG